MLSDPAKPRGIVYVIDDDDHVRAGLINLLESVGLQAQGFGSTAEFLAVSRPDAPECLVLDVRLPGPSGLDFQSMLARANIKIPIIFITAFGDVRMSATAIKAGAVEFFEKPVREQDLLDAIGVAIEANRVDREKSRLMTELQLRFESLSSREREVMALVTAGKMNKQIAVEVGITEITVKFHRSNLMKKIGAKSLADLVRIADQLGPIQR